MIVDRSYAGENLVFVVGCPRSGTTWVQRLLACHPRVRTGQESNLFSDYVGLLLRRWRVGLALTERGGVGLACYFTEREFLDLLHGFLRALLQRMLEPVAPDEIFVEKTPNHALYWPEIRELLPASRIIHVLRDPRDVVASLLAASRTWAAGSWAPRRARQAAAMWVRAVDAVRAASRAIPPTHFLEVRYEALYEAPLETLARMRDFLGLEWSSDAMRRAFEANRVPRTGSARATPIPLFGQAALASGPSVIDPEGFIRRAQPGGWTSDLSAIEKVWVWRVARRAARAAGYRIALR